MPSPRPVVAPATTLPYTSKLSAALVCPSAPITAAGLAPAANARAQNVRRRSWQVARAIGGLPAFARALFARSSAGPRACRAMLERAGELVRLQPSAGGLSCFEEPSSGDGVHG